MSRAEPVAYDGVARTLHWSIALLVILQGVVGWRFGEAPPSPLKGGLGFLHESVGILILVLVAVRLGWRLGHRPPATAQRSARWLHALAYLLLFALCLTGWLAASSGRAPGPLRVFGLLPWPALPVPAGGALRHILHEAAETVHGGLFYALAAVVLLHVLAALRHRFWLRDGTLARMLPAGDRVAGPVVLGVAVTLAVAAGWAAGPPPGITPGTAFPGTDDDDDTPLPAATATDVHYANESRSQTLDLYLPRAHAGPIPVVVYIHGGAFMFGDKRDRPRGGFAHDVAALLGAGIGLASINYRLSGEARWPAAVDDTRAAVRWLHDNAPRYGIDGDAIGVWGKSAGGYLAVMAAFTGTRATHDAVAALVAMYAPVDFARMDAELKADGCTGGMGAHGDAGSPESRFLGAALATIPARVADANPANHLPAQALPVLLQAGAADCAVPHAQSANLAALLTERFGAGSVRLDILPGAEHADPAFDEPRNLEVVVDFLRAALHPGVPAGTH
jgi:cytochrome b561/acetyl esterase/lipase